jgi:hypothetical protein
MMASCSLGQFIMWLHHLIAYIVINTIKAQGSSYLYSPTTQ